VVLNHGRIHEQGDHDALMAIPQGVYQRLYLLQQLESHEDGVLPEAVLAKDLFGAGA